MAMKIRQRQIEQDRIEFISAGEFQRRFTSGRRFMFKTGFVEHQFDSACHRTIILDEQNAHYNCLPRQQIPISLTRNQVLLGFI